MPDPSLQYAIEVVDETRNMPIGDATRYLFDRYRTSSSPFREELFLAVAAALNASRLQADASRAHQGTAT